jgi:DNA-binding NarL/FixJ family response regulator
MALNAILQLKSVIHNLQPELRAEDFNRHKEQMLSLVDTLQALQGEAPDGNGNGNGADPLHAKLSRREREVMSMLLSGQRLKEIAAKLDISVKTVTTHRSRLMKKLRVDDNLGLYRYGIRQGLIGL